MSVECYRCGDAISGHPVELVRHPDGERVEIHGSCLLKSYSAKAYEEDAEKKWTHGSHADKPLTDHVDGLIESDSDGSETYERGRELMEAQG